MGHRMPLSWPLTPHAMPSPHTTDTATADTAATENVAAMEAAEATNLAIIARQPIVDAQRAVYGYELFDRTTASDHHTAASDAALLFNALSNAGTEALVGKKRCSSTARTKAWPAATWSSSTPKKWCSRYRRSRARPRRRTSRGALPRCRPCASAAFASLSTSRCCAAPTPAGYRWRASSSSTCKPSSRNSPRRWCNSRVRTARPRSSPKKSKPPSSSSAWQTSA